MNPLLGPMITLPLHPAEAVQIGSSCFSFAALDGKIFYFSDLEAYALPPFRAAGFPRLILIVAEVSS
ncbi:MAG: hypothetical protein OXC26_19890 [Albidovulum sp.]|nr:hypothetical protein [Albidovulum sp.]